MNEKLKVAILEVLGHRVDSQKVADLADRISREFCLIERGDEKANETMEQLLADKQRLEDNNKELWSWITDLQATLKKMKNLYNAVCDENDQLRRELDEYKDFCVSNHQPEIALRERIAKLEAERDEYKSLYEKQLAGRQA